MRFPYEGFTFNVVDVGGQKSERRKWIHCFQGVTALLYVAALSDYDLTMEEEMGTSRYRDSLDMFDKVVNNKYFEEVNVVLFLNKKDIFAKKIKTTPMTVVAPDFPKGKDPNSYEDCVSYIEDCYRKHNTCHGRNIYVHRTCATDTSNIEKVWKAIHEVLVKKQLAEIDGSQFL